MPPKPPVAKSWVEATAGNTGVGLALVAAARGYGPVCVMPAGANVVAALRIAARGGLDGPVVTMLPDSWDRYRAKPWMQEWAP